MDYELKFNIITPTNEYLISDGNFRVWLKNNSSSNYILYNIGVKGTSYLSAQATALTNVKRIYNHFRRGELAEIKIRFIGKTCDVYENGCHVMSYTFTAANFDSESMLNNVFNNSNRILFQMTNVNGQVWKIKNITAKQI